MVNPGQALSELKNAFDSMGRGDISQDISKLAQQIGTKKEEAAVKNDADPARLALSQIKKQGTIAHELV